MKKMPSLDTEAKSSGAPPEEESNETDSNPTSEMPTPEEGTSILDSIMDNYRNKRATGSPRQRLRTTFSGTPSPDEVKQIESEEEFSDQPQDCGVQ